MPIIKCCKDCVAPKRHIGCHADCKEYLEEKAQYEKAKQKIKETKGPSICKSDWENNYCKRRKKH